MEDNKKQIQELVNRFIGFQQSLRLGNGVFAGRYKKYLRSHKTWNKLREGNWEGHVNSERILADLQAFARFIDAAQNFDVDEFIPTLPFVRRANAEFDRLLGATKDRRCMVVLAPEGCDKSWWASAAVRMEPINRFYLRLSFTWRERPFSLARAFAEKIGADEERSPAGQVKALIKKLNERQETIFFIDEGHNGGVAVMKLIKDLIDESPARFVYLAFPTEFDRVRSSGMSAMGEAKQFLRRCIRPVFDDYRTGIGAADIAAYLVARGLSNTAELKTVAEELVPPLSQNYNLSTLADAFDEAENTADLEGRPVTLEKVSTEVTALISTATARRATEAMRKSGGSK